LGIRTQLFGLMLLLVLTGGGVLLLDEFSQAQSQRALRGLVEGPLASLRRIKAMSDAYSAAAGRGCAQPYRRALAGADDASAWP
jgi:hypothetical protein